MTDLQKKIIEELLDDFEEAIKDYERSTGMPDLKAAMKKLELARNNINYAINQMLVGGEVDLDLACIFYEKNK